MKDTSYARTIATVPWFAKSAIAEAAHIVAPLISCQLAYDVILGFNCGSALDMTPYADAASGFRPLYPIADRKCVASDNAVGSTIDPKEHALLFFQALV